MTDQPEVTNNFTRTCFGCGRQETIRNGRARRHGCRWRLLSRYRWSAYLEGWHAAHRFAVENPDDPMVQADGFDYGSGWAGYMRQGRDEGSLRVAM